jgi:hypothetical protein
MSYGVVNTMVPGRGDGKTESGESAMDSALDQLGQCEDQQEQPFKPLCRHDYP